ncbi:hypothetical protein SGHV112 [Glossina pallidipes salivary gland hypertrophy virus]|uniref:Uncharacterized protein n=1 Tax=Glossina hytrovirus (isolate Glossina pallidipes/Ethiopia/Seibersdorf/-) TaxID=379529 RepID=B0YLR6_GHVS|nr:hypothetical protein SGHV112 [Glossina pallidipes salivary gland hypertrophy virus]ABQ08885.1 hypothetical protein SGHV112 [Glossina pallidipes salivary gland hypertrophy virus]
MAVICILLLLITAITAQDTTPIAAQDTTPISKETTLIPEEYDSTITAIDEKEFIYNDIINATIQLLTESTKDDHNVQLLTESTKDDQTLFEQLTKNIEIAFNYIEKHPHLSYLIVILVTIITNMLIFCLCNLSPRLRQCALRKLYVDISRFLIPDSIRLLEMKKISV